MLILLIVVVLLFLFILLLLLLLLILHLFTTTSVGAGMSGSVEELDKPAVTAERGSVDHFLFSFLIIYLSVCSPEKGFCRKNVNLVLVFWSH